MARQSRGASDGSSVIVYARSHVDSREASSRSSTGWCGDHARHPRPHSAATADDPIHAGLVGCRRVGCPGGGHAAIRRPSRKGRQHHADRGVADDQFDPAAGDLDTTLDQRVVAARTPPHHRRGPCPAGTEGQRLGRHRRDQGRRSGARVRRGGVHRRSGHSVSATVATTAPSSTTPAPTGRRRPPQRRGRS